MAYRSRTNWAAIVLAVLFIGAAVFLGIVTEGYKNWDTSTWFDKQEEQTPPVISDENGNDLADGQIHAMPQAMVFRSSTLASGANAAVTLKATVNPDTAENKAVDWAVEWFDSSAAWANGKTVTDYVTATPSADGSATATITCKQDFGAKIRITVTSRENPDAFASCTVDLKQKLVGVNVSLGVAGGSTYATLTKSAPTATIVPDFSAVAQSVTYEGVYSEVYTLPADSATFKGVLAPSAELLEGLSAGGFKPAAPIEFTNSLSGLPGNTFFTTVIGSNYTAAQQNQVVNILKGLDGPAYHIDVKVSDSSIAVYGLKIDMSSFGDRVESVTLDKGTVVF